MSLFAEEFRVDAGIHVADGDGSAVCVGDGGNVDSVQEPSKDVVETPDNILEVLVGRKDVIKDHISALNAGGTFKRQSLGCKSRR